MDEMEQKLGNILNNPQLMQQIMTMAQSLEQGNTESNPGQSKQPFPELDTGTLQKLSGIASQGKIDSQQQALLSALGPYLSQDRVSKLERAMRAQKMARTASLLLGQNGLSFLRGR